MANGAAVEIGVETGQPLRRLLRPFSSVVVRASSRIWSGHLAVEIQTLLAVDDDLVALVHRAGFQLR